MQYIPFNQLKRIIIRYRSLRGNEISPYFAVEYDQFLRYLYDFKNLKFNVRSFNNECILSFYNQLLKGLENRFAFFFDNFPNLFLDDPIPQDIKNFYNCYNEIILDNRERFEGILIHDVFIERLNRLSSEQNFVFRELDSLFSSRKSKDPIPDSILRIGDHRIAVEFKSRGFVDKHLLLKDYHSKKYQKYIDKHEIEEIFILHSIYPFDFDHIPQYYLGIPFISPSTDFALFIPLELYEKLPISIGSPLKEKRKNYYGVTLNKARKNDLLYRGWGNLINNIITHLNNGFIENYPDSNIRCRTCNKYYHYRKDCHPYTRNLRNYTYGYCYSCIQETLGNLSVFLHDNIISDMIDDEVNNIIENESDFY